MRLSLTLSLVLFTGASLRAEAPPIQGTLPEDLLPGLAPLLKEAVERSPTSISASIAVAERPGELAAPPPGRRCGSRTAP